jgi:hypothetical protein
MLEKNVLLIQSSGAACGVCGQKIARGDAAIRVKFDIPVFFVATTLDREMHLKCAESLVEIVQRRLLEAGWK